MVNVLAVNNYPTLERFEKLSACLEANGATVSSIPWAEASTEEFGSFDGVVLSGSPNMMSERRVQEKFGHEVDAVKDSKVPMLGVCFGHQLIAHAFGAPVVKDGRHILDFVKTSIFYSDGLFAELPKTLNLLESRHEVVSSLPDGFELLARSRTTQVAAMKHR
ncbi:MAG: hypothetical protein HY297_01495, partial [Thaumarchaeota archaeon]|nr:hypothetical protein [Nitrososphaerota archaeon]